MRFQIRFDERHDDYHLVDIGNQHMLAVPRSTGQNAMPGLDPLDYSFVTHGRKDPNSVARGNDAPFVSSQTSQNSTNRAFKLPAVIAFHDRLKSVNSQDSTGNTGVDINAGHFG